MRGWVCHVQLLLALASTVDSVALCTDQAKITSSNNASVVACVSFAVGMYLPSCCLEMNVVQSRLLAVAVCLSPQFLLSANMQQYFNNIWSIVEDIV
jgi:hypothetical protein